MASPANVAPASEVLGAVETLFVANVDAVFNVAFRILWNRADAEDVVQQSFLKALSRLGQLRDAGSARPWLLQIAYRESITVMRSRREVPTDPHELPEAAATGSDPAECTVAAELAHIVSGALQRMHADERMAVVLRDVEQLPMTEVAKITGVGLSAAKMRVHRGRAALRTIISQQEVR